MPRLSRLALCLYCRGFTISCRYSINQSASWRKIRRKLINWFSLFFRVETSITFMESFSGLVPRVCFENRKSECGDFELREHCLLNLKAKGVLSILQYYSVRSKLTYDIAIFVTLLSQERQLPTLELLTIQLWNFTCICASHPQSRTNSHLVLSHRIYKKSYIFRISG